MSSHQQRSSHSIGSPLMTIKNELLLGAVVRGELPTVRRLLDRHKADINSKNSNGLGCLQLAILNGHTKLAEFLIQKGVDIHMMDSEGHSALHDAALVENVVLVRKLISKGLSPLLTTNLKELVIDLAGSVQMEKLLCEEMYQAGEIKLARQYYFYLGLDRDEAEKMDNAGRPLVSRGIHPPPPRSHQKHQGGPVGCKSTLRAHVSSSSSPKTEFKKSSGPQSTSQVSKNISTHACRVHPSAKIANSAENESAGKVSVSGRANCQATELGSLPSNGPDSVGSHRNVLAEYKEQTPPPSLSETASSETLSDSVIDSDESSGNSVQSTSSDLSAGSSSSSLTQNQPNQELTKSQRELDPPATVCESPQSARNPSPKQARESAAIKALQRHSSFQLQIGLSLQSDQFSTLEEEDFFAADEEEDQFSTSPRQASISSKGSSLNSPGLANRRQRAASLRADWFLPNRPPIARQQRRTPKLLNKTVSFADLPMTRSKPMFVGQTSKGGSGSSTMGTEKVEKTPNRTTVSNQLTHSLSTNVLDRYISNYNPEREKPKPETCETDSLFDAGIRALSLKPRKSSIASPMRRHHSEGMLTRRRSVTFQPEVLLQEIVTDGDVKAVSEILESGMIEDVNKMSPSGLTALHQSAIDGNIECAKTLVAKGANVNCTDCEKWTPLHAAVMNGSVEFVRFLLASGAKPNQKNDNGETAYDMAKSGAIRKMLLNAMNGGSPDADEFSDGEYSGEEEEEYSHAETESDDDLEGEGSGLFDSNGEKTSLKERLGLTHTSALNNTQGNSVTPSPDLDNVFGGSQVFQRQEHELTSSTSSYGSIFESEDRVKEMDKKFSGNTTTKTLNTESDTDKISESGISTMEGSSDCSHRSRVLSSEDEAITLDSDLDPNSLDYEFQEACLYCDVDRVLKLIKCKHDIDINRVNKTSGITALHHSVLEENFALVQHLVKDFDADLHIQDVDGWTPLHAASAVGSIQIAQFLLDRGAKPSSLNLSCEFPVDVAEDEAMEKLLKNAMLGNSTEKCLIR